MGHGNLKVQFLGLGLIQFHGSAIAKCLVFLFDFVTFLFFLLGFLNIGILNMGVLLHSFSQNLPPRPLFFLALKGILMQTESAVQRLHKTYITTDTIT